MTLSATPDRIVLTGFMGSGKTTVGRLLAARLCWAFLDLDTEIARRTGLSVPDIFALRGEPYFREQESLALAECLQQAQAVIALGGGAVESAANRERLHAAPRTSVVYLAGHFDALSARCASQPGTRPVLADAALARQRFARRLPLYADVATLTLDSTGCSPDELVARLLTTYQSPLPRS